MQLRCGKICRAALALQPIAAVLEDGTIGRVGEREIHRRCGFAWGANRHLAGEYKLKMTECAELCRVALDKHATPVSRILAIAIRMLKHEMPGLRLLVSYADLNRGHLGKIYQASNWMYVGTQGMRPASC